MNQESTPSESKKRPRIRHLSEGITIRLDAATLEQVRTLARQEGIGPTTLVRMWVLQQLREQQRGSIPRDSS